MIGKTKYIAQREGIIFILSAPSGTGKTTLIKGLRAIYPDIKLSVSFTTRARRAGEIHGRDYYFVRSTKFAAMKANGDFAEWAKVHDFFYARRADRWTNVFVTARTSFWTLTSRGRERSSASIPGRSRSFSCRLHGGSCSEGWPCEAPTARRQSVGDWSMPEVK